MSVVGLLRPTLELNGTVLKSRDQYCVSSSVCPHQCFTSGDGFGWVKKKIKKSHCVFLLFVFCGGGVGGGGSFLSVFHNCGRRLPRENCRLNTSADCRVTVASFSSRHAGQT